MFKGIEDQMKELLPTKADMCRKIMTREQYHQQYPQAKEIFSQIPVFLPKEPGLYLSSAPPPPKSPK